MKDEDDAPRVQGVNDEGVGPELGVLLEHVVEATDLIHARHEDEDRGREVQIGRVLEAETLEQAYDLRSPARRQPPDGVKDEDQRGERLTRS